jgi:23S rRNA pseudouridine2605 synthase
VNGVVVRALGERADPVRDAVALDGERIAAPSTRRTVLLHKPRGVVSTLRDPEGRPTARMLLAGIRERLYPVGRLDVNTTGLLLFSNDGALTAALLHPRQAVPRVYQAKVRGTPSEETIIRLRRGVRLEDGRTAPARVRVLERLPTKTWLEILVQEGRTHLVRRMCDAVGHPVEKLTRVRFGPLALGSLPPGSWRALSPRELELLQIAAGLSAGVPGGPRRGRDTPPRKRRPRVAARARDEARAPSSSPREGPPRGPRPRARPPRPSRPSRA